MHSGINKVEASLKDQLVFIEGTAPPSSIVSAIQNTGRDAILRGSGTSNSMFGSLLRGYVRPGVFLIMIGPQLRLGVVNRFGRLYPRNTLNYGCQ
jgi:hypothetical protein